MFKTNCRAFKQKQLSWKPTIDRLTDVIFLTCNTIVKWFRNRAFMCLFVESSIENQVNKTSCQKSLNLLKWCPAVNNYVYIYKLFTSIYNVKDKNIFKYELITWNVKINRILILKWHLRFKNLHATTRSTSSTVPPAAPVGISQVRESTETAAGSEEC